MILDGGKLFDGPLPGGAIKSGLASGDTEFGDSVGEPGGVINGPDDLVLFGHGVPVCTLTEKFGSHAAPSGHSGPVRGTSNSPLQISSRSVGKVVVRPGPSGGIWSL